MYLPTTGDNLASIVELISIGFSGSSPSGEVRAHIGGEGK